MPTLADIAREARVSVATVSRALNNSGYVRPDVRERIRRIAEEKHYVPNQLARSLLEGRTHRVLLVLPDITNPFFASVARGVEDSLAAHDVEVIVANADDNPHKERNYVRRAVGRGVDGIIAIAASSSPEDIAHFRSLKAPLVLVDRACEGIQSDVVVSGNESGAYQAARHLLALGHQQIATITGPLRLKSAADRLAGFQRAVREYRVPSSHVVTIEGDFREEGGHRAALQLMDIIPRPTAVFAANDLMALGALEALEERRVRVPEDVALVGYDDIPYSVRIRPRLTTVAQPKYEMGATAAELLMRRMSDPGRPFQWVVLEPRLVVRESSVVRVMEPLVAQPAPAAREPRREALEDPGESGSGKDEDRERSGR